MSLNIKIRNVKGFETIISVNPNMTIGDAKKLFFGDIRTTHLKFNADLYITIKPFLIMELKMVILFQNAVHPEEAQDSVYVLLMLRKIIQEL